MNWPPRSKEETPEITGRPDEPWWTRRAISYIEEYLTKEMRVLEWGAGGSTLWLAKRCGSLLSIESDPTFQNMAAAELAAAGFPTDRYRVELRPLNFRYAVVSGQYDLAIVDGRMRVACCDCATKVLAPGGLLLLDNAERKEYAQARNQLASWEILETRNGMWHTYIWRKPNA